MINIVLNRHLLQVVQEPARGKNILDRCFTNCEHLTSKVEVSPGISDHEIVSIDVSLALPHLKKKPIAFVSTPRMTSVRSHQN